MAIEQLPDGRWRVDVEPVKGKRFRKTLKTKAEAMRFEATCRTKSIDTPEWSPRLKDRCSGLLIPDTNLGENDRHREVSDDKATSYVFH